MSVPRSVGWAVGGGRANGAEGLHRLATGYSRSMLTVEIAVGSLLLLILVVFTLIVNPPNAWLSRKKKKDS